MLVWSYVPLFLHVFTSVWNWQTNLSCF